MGLTVHYGLKTTQKDPDKVKALLEKMRQIALDLPFEKVGPIRRASQKLLKTPIEDLRGKPGFEMILDGLRSIELPWTKKTHKHKSGGTSSSSCSVDIQPLEMFSFDIIPGPGSEWISLGFCLYPSEVEVTYKPKNDRKFNTYFEDGGMGVFRFDWTKWDRWLKKNNNGMRTPVCYEKQIKMKTRMGGWRWGSFCKTQYASDPQCGGIPNFIRCHVGLIYLLDQIKKLPTVKVDYDDEGNYGRSYYTDDWKVPNPVYTWHDGKYSVPELIKEIGEWNEMIASMFGSMKDAMGQSGMQLEGPIQNYSNFEQLEFKGIDQEGMQKFLQAMKALADKAKEQVA